MIRAPYEAPQEPVGVCSRRGLLRGPAVQRGISLEGFDDETLASLTRHRELPALHLSTCALGPRAIAALSSLTSLRELSLWRCKVTAPGLDDATWSQLGTLEATYNEETTRAALSPDGAQVLIAHAAVEDAAGGVSAGALGRARREGCRVVAR